MRIQILNGAFDVVSTRDTVSWARNLLKSGQRGWLATVNVSILIMMRDDPRLQQFVDKAAMVVADGTPLVWASKLAGPGLPERVTGVDLVEELCQLCVDDGVKLYLLGASREVVDDVAQNLKARYQGLQIAGVADGYFDDTTAGDRARAVRESGASILLVGMGVPKQERFIEDYWDELGVNLAIGVGGSFEVVAGRKKRAPLWMQKVALEWLYRLMQEPKRLAKRYLVTNTAFMGLLALDILLRRSPKGVDDREPSQSFLRTAERIAS